MTDRRYREGSSTIPEMGVHYKRSGSALAWEQVNEIVTTAMKVAGTYVRTE